MAMKSPACCSTLCYRMPEHIQSAHSVGAFDAYILVQNHNFNAKFLWCAIPIMCPAPILWCALFANSHVTLAAGLNSTSVSVECCTTGSSYARLNSSRTNKPTCFQHTRPGSTTAKCIPKPVTASGFFNQGPGSGSLFLARQPGNCSAALAVGSVNVSCPLGDAANKIGFKIVTPAAYR
jgi:hypothetical protein